MKAEKLTNVRPVGRITTRDISVKNPNHRFYANGVAVSNSHGYEYGAVTAVQLWLRHNYFPQFMTALINNTKQGKKKHGSTNLVVDYVNYARKNGVDVLPPDVNKSGVEFKMEDGCIRFSLRHIRNVASMADLISEHAPFRDFEDFDNRVKIVAANDEPEETSQMDLFSARPKAQSKSSGRRLNRRVVESLIYSGAMDCFGKRSEVLKQFECLRGIKLEDVPTTNHKWRSREVEMIGLCLSINPIQKQLLELIGERKWKIPSTMKKPGRIELCGRVETIDKRWSRNGNQFCEVTLTDDIEVVSFYVFAGQMEQFLGAIGEGDIVTVGLTKFEDGDRMFYSERKGFEVLEKAGQK